MNYLFSNFSNDPQQYREAEAFWKYYWNILIEHIGESFLWQCPWLNTTFADGTPMLDGNPIFSAFSPGRELGIRVIQMEPAGDPREFTVWTDKFAKDEPEEIAELVISCVLTRETLLYSIDAMTQWITQRELWLTRKHDLLIFPRSKGSARQTCSEMAAE